MNIFIIVVMEVVMMILLMFFVDKGGMCKEIVAFICVIGIHSSESLEWKRIFPTCQTS